MIGKNKIKQVKSLNDKKYRLREQLFLVEGDKIVTEVLQSPLEVTELYATDKFLNEYSALVQSASKVISAGSDEIRKLSLQKQPQSSLALCALPKASDLPEQLGGYSFYLDGIQDPGNLGTIIRTCDWFGIKNLFCSPDTADVFNPKVIQSSMGSFCRILPVYTPFDAVAMLAEKFKIPLLGTFMEGESIYSYNFQQGGIIVLGNEGRGIREQVATKTTTRLTIPSFSNSDSKAESLNVAVTAGVLCSEIRRRIIIRNENLR